MICYQMSTEFIEWLMDQLNQREWTQADLVRRSGLTSAAVSRIVSGLRRPGTEACTAIANAIDLPPETVYRIAGLLPPESPLETELKEVNYRLSQLEPYERFEAIQFIRFIHERRARYARPDTGPPLERPE